ncbi:SDR family oxidoreductase [Rheinheimera sp. UJ63]|uniref:SDR family oxidoreductase n=1 Tax=Rheinheimera sp. UJ63 TaxID=2910157 RepID=UPI001F21C872|nr:SDR family oxidoreductase [Rheinheimera sp. UJ63]MCF4009355.1 SDR family oxidoreductase [Rheinheimera sp. UJ63]
MSDKKVRNDHHPIEQNITNKGNKMNLKDKTIVITGGAQGLGLEMARMCASEGAKLALIDMNAEQLAAAKAELSAHTTVHVYQANVAAEGEVEATFSQIDSDFNGIDGLINNAGILRDGLLLKFKDGEITSKMPLAQFQSVIDVNLTGVFLCGREAAAAMVKRGNKGVIINMSSVARGGNMGQTNYAASKAGVVAMTVTWARELGRYGIRVGAIAPGVIRTAMTDAMKPEARDRLEKMKPVGRLGEASEVAHTAKYIFENDFFTGRVVEIDGGISM